MYKTILALFCSLIASLSFADNCDNTRNTYDDIYCTNKIYASADADLNKNYQQLRSKMNMTQQKILKKSQLAWIRHRDVTCSDEQQNSVDVECRLSSTQQRNHWLLERLRECNTFGCKTTRLSQ